MSITLGSINVNKRLGGQEVLEAFEAWLRRHHIDLVVVQEPVAASQSLPATIGDYRLVGGNELVAVWIKGNWLTPEVQQMAPYWQRIRLAGMTVLNVYLSHESTVIRAAQLKPVQEAAAGEFAAAVMVVGDFNIAPNPQDGLNNGRISTFNTKTDRAALQRLLAAAQLVDLVPSTGPEFTITQTIGSYHTQFRSDLALVPTWLLGNARLTYDHHVRQGPDRLTDHSGLVLELDLTAGGQDTKETPSIVHPETRAVPYCQPQNTAMDRRRRSLIAKTVVGDLWRSLGIQSILDFGCGKGRDVEYYRSVGIDADGYDTGRPEFSNRPDRRYDMVVLCYVLNVLDSENSRLDALQDAKQYLNPGGTMLVVTRSQETIDKAARKGRWERHSDGYWSNKSRGMFQHGLTHDEIERLGLMVGMALHPADRTLRRIPEASACLLKRKLT